MWLFFCELSVSTLALELSRSVLQQLVSCMYGKAHKQHKVEVCIHLAVALTDKEAVLFLTRLAALANAMTAVGPVREQWQATFLDLLYTMCTRVVPPHVSTADLDTGSFQITEAIFGSA